VNTVMNVRASQKAGNSSQDKQLLASQEGLFSMELLKAGSCKLDNKPSGFTKPR
jgi:hypothetical protein